MFLRLRLATMLLTLGVLMANLAACKKADCPTFINKAIECDGNAKYKEKMLKRCQTRLEKADAEVKPLITKMLACSGKSVCGEFKDCVREQRKAMFRARVPMRLRKAKEKIKALAAEKQWGKALRKCSYDFSARRVLKDKESTAKAKKRAKEYYDYCRSNIPLWLKTLAKNGGSDKYISLCYFSKRRPNKFWERLGADDKYLAAVKTHCANIKLAKTLKKLEDGAAKSIAKGYFPYNCSVKYVKKSADAGDTYKKLQSLCFVKIGYPILVAKHAKIARKRFKYCGYTEKKILKGFVEFKLPIADDQKTVMKFYAKLCKIDLSL